MAPIRRDFTLTDLAAPAKAAGIDRAVLVQVLPSLAETAEFRVLAGESNLIAGVVGWAGLTSSAVSGDALRVVSSGLPGHTVVSEFSWAHSVMNVLLRSCGVVSAATYRSGRSTATFLARARNQLRSSLWASSITTVPGRAVGC